jgi:hypothetical protein
MQVVSIPTMVASYLRCPPLAVDDFRILIAGVWRYLGKGTDKDVFPEVRSLASIINGETSPLAKTSDSSLMVDVETELDFKSLNLVSPVDSIPRFIEAIEFCCDSSEAMLFSKIELSHLRRLFEQMVDRVGDEEFTVRQTLHRVERNLDRFAKAVEIWTMTEQASKNPVAPSEPTEKQVPPCISGGAAEPPVLTASDPKAAAYKENGEWCTAAYAKRRYAFIGSQLYRASTNAKGFRVCQKAATYIKIARTKAQVGTGKRGQVYVFHAGDLRRLADALSEAEGE